MAASTRRFAAYPEFGAMSDLIDRAWAGGVMSVRYEDPWLTVHVGDCRDVLATLPAESVHCVVTSPPYWGLRDYGTATWDGGDPECDHSAGPLTSSKSGLAGYTSDNIKLRTNGVPFRGRCGKCGAIRVDAQLGLEATPEEYVANMVAVFREVRRVLRNDGTVWLNLGDSYASQATNSDAGGSFQAERGAYRAGRPDRRGVQTGMKPKDLVGIPWMVAFALRADGWYLRSDIIWAKTNPMPESVTDRPTKAHEMVFLLSKSPRYYFDSEAVREGVAVAGVVQRPDRDREPLVLRQNLGLEDSRSSVASVGVRLASAVLDVAERQHQLGLLPLDAQVRQQGPDDDAGPLVVGVPVMRRAAAEAARFADGDVPAKEFLREMDRLCVALPDGDDLKEAWRGAIAPDSRPLIDTDGDGPVGVSDPGEVGKFQFGHGNKYTAEGTTSSRARVTGRGHGKEAERQPGRQPQRSNSGGFPSVGRNIRSVWTVATQPYPGAHFAVMPEALVEPCILAGCPEGGTVLDPFGGSGTVAVVAQRHRRRAVLIELNPEYADQSVVRASRSWGKGGRVRRGAKPPPDGSWVAEAAS